MLWPFSREVGRSVIAKAHELPLCPGTLGKKVFRQGLNSPPGAAHLQKRHLPSLRATSCPRAPSTAGAPGSHQRPGGAGETVEFIFLTFLNHHRGLPGRDTAS